MHPDLETLLLCRDNQLPPDRLQKVRLHLCSCDPCGLAYQRLRQAIVGRPAPDPGPYLLAGIRARIRDWESQRASDLWIQGIKTRVVKQIGPFLGQRAADSLLQPVAADARNLLSTIEPVLAEFLGDRAASSLVGRVAGTAL